MKILSIECSASPASVAITENGNILAEAFVNIKMTHSQTLMPMVQSVLNSCFTDMSDIEGIAVSAGPGSFTGIRIGISAAKGLATPKELPCVPVSTLYAMAQGFADRNCIVCGVMDARCNQVYNALFKWDNGELSRLCEDRALMCNELAAEIENICLEYHGEIIICGDGADLFFPFISHLPQTTAAYGRNKYQNAVGVGFAAENSFLSGNTISPDKLLPVYLRLPQAERELKAKLNRSGNL